ncbi:MAG: DUF1553 domain-containing protein [Limisphaerales bacterium]
MTPRARTFLLAMAAAGGLASAGPAPTGSADDPSFLERVQPLLQSRCVSCHGPEKQKGALRLDSREATLAGGDLGPAVIPGKPEESLLFQAVLHARADLEMPPKDKLSAPEIDLLGRWIRAGAPWPAPDAVAAPASRVESSPPRLGDAWSDPGNPIRRIFHGERLDLWSLKPLARVSPPPFTGASGASPKGRRNPVDLFLEARFPRAEDPPTPEADRRTLARRLHFDLIGLPPAPDVIDRFLADTRPDAYERLVDALLASPRYGEHQARLWLDVIRYSDSNGFDWDEFRPQAWRFRDYVVRAFNADKPYDQFITEQLAGDELLAGPPRTADEQDRLVATGYLRLGPQDNSAPLFNEQSRARSEWLADLTETTGSAFLGITLSCCRCHDHKFDPFSQADHFRIRAFFEPVTRGDDLALDLADEQEAIHAQHRDVQGRIEPLAAERARLLRVVKERIRSRRVAALPESERQLLATKGDPRPKDVEDRATALEKRVAVSDEDAVKSAPEPEKEALESLRRRIDALEKSKRPFSRGLLATDTREPTPPTRIHFQGDPKAEREIVAPGFLSILDPNPALIRPPASTNTTGRRLTLAAWIASPDNPLTVRVHVNRAWQAFFGRGLVATANDLGLAGAPPTHPELLDWLAGEFLRGGWSTKRLHRLLVTSAAYRRASSPAASPDNTWFTRQNLRRLSAEQLRDALLAVAGILRHQDGGPPSWPELPADVLRANPAFLDDNAEKTKGWYPSPPDQRSVRSVFLVQKRTVKVPFLETFDLPENSTSCPRRTESIVAPQALSLLNGPEAVEAARAFAARVVREAEPRPGAQVRQAFRIALQRPPTPAEHARAEAYLAESSLAELCRALLNLNEFAFID